MLKQIMRKNNIFKKISDNIKKFFTDWKTTKIDTRNREQFHIDIRQEVANPDSKFNQFKMAIDEKNETLSVIISLPDNFQIMGTDAQKYYKLHELAIPFNQYLSRDLNWGEYVSAPEFFYIEEDTSGENGSVNQELENSGITNGESCSYLAIWKFEPIVKKNTKYWLKHISFWMVNISLLVILIASLIVLL